MDAATDNRPAPRPDTGFYPIGEGAVVFCEASQNLYSLDPLACFCWLEFGEGHGVSSVAAALAAETGESPADVEPRIAEVASFFAEAGLVQGAALPPSICAPRPTPEVIPPAGLAAALDMAAATIHVRLLDHVVRLNFTDDGLAARFRPILAPIETGPREDALEASVVRVDGHLYGCKGREPVYSTRGPYTPAAVVENIAYSTALRETDYVVSIHCGSVGVGDDGAGGPSGWLAMPAASGSGKTTLTAALAASGLPYGTDELIVLNESLVAHPVSFPLCVKEASWPVLKGRYPDIDSLPAYRRFGKRARYVPPARPIPPAPPRPVAGLVFPKYDPESATELRPVDPMTGLKRVFDQALSIPQRLDLATVERLVAWAADKPFYELPIGDLDDAVALMRDLARDLAR